MSTDYKKQSWYHNDNEFPSLKEMNHYHKPIVEFALHILKNKKAKVIDFGCGNGALLERLCKSNKNIVPYGVDINPERIKHAKLLFPEFANNFFLGNMFENEQIWQVKRYDLAILMPGRFLETKNNRRKGLFKSKIRKQCSILLVYTYGSRTGKWRDLNELGKRIKIKLLPKPVKNNVSLGKFI